MARQICEFTITAEEDGLLHQLRNTVKQNPIVQEIESTYPGKGEHIFFSDSRLVRFLFAREKNVEKAAQMWENWAKWYLEERPELIQKEKIQEEIDAKKAFWFKHDNKNNPCLIVMIKNHIPVVEKIEQARKFFVWTMEQGIKMAEQNGTNRLTIIWDGKGFSRSQLNSAFLDFIKIVAKSLQDYYPNRLAAIYVTDPDFLFRIGYGILKPFLSTVITSKVNQIPMKDLNKYFASNCILPEHGGDANQVSPLSPNYVQESHRSNVLQGGSQHQISQQHNYLHADNQHNNHHQNNHLNNSMMTEEFHSIANDSRIFYDNQSFSQLRVAHHEINTQQQILIEGQSPLTNSGCCSSQCSIF